MSTSYLNDIFPRFLSKITDYSHNSMTIQDRNTTFGGYIKSVSSKFVECNKDLSLRVEPDGNTDLFNGDGVTVSFAMTSTASTGSEYVVLVSGATATTGINYTVSGLTVTFVTGYIPATGTNSVSISWEFAGSYDEDLTDLEQEIVSNMMVIEWLSPILLHSDLLEERLGSKDFQQFSSSEKIKQLKNLKKETSSEIDTLLVKYTSKITGFSGLSK
jgi:hypothetical protein